MAGLDSRYICTSDLESIFLDKLNGLVLAGGRVEFYVENSNTPKEVFTTTGSPPSTFSTLGSVVTLDSIGQYSDGVNSVVVYYFPYDEAGALQLYRVRVYSSDNILQFTREAWPPLASNLAPTNNADTGVKNYIPNGQFLAHNDHIITDTNTEPGITISEIAQGGWSFKKTTAGTGSYTVTFVTNSGFPSGLQDYPPFSVNINCTVFDASDTTRDLTIQWPNVNTFSRKLTGTETNNYNLFFKAKLNSGTSEIFGIYLISYFGTGGSPTVETLIGSKTVTANFEPTEFNLTIPMPDNSGFTVGAGSFVAIAIRSPANTFNAQFTDFALTLGATTRSQFPVMTNDEQLSRGVAGWMPTPNPDGSDLYLPLVLTQQGMTFDHSEIGMIYARTGFSSGNELYLNGTTQLYTGYSALGIPYKRLADYLIASTPNINITDGGLGLSAALTAGAINGTIPMWGTGDNFVTLYQNPALLTTIIFVQLNTVAAGVVADGAVGTGWTLAALIANSTYQWTVTGVPTAGEYWTFTDGSLGLVYNVWYSVDGLGTAPATPTGANIEVALDSGITTGETIRRTLVAVNQYQFKLLNLAGEFLRGLDTSATLDPDAATRTIPSITFGATALTGANLGSIQSFAVQSHTHGFSVPFSNEATSRGGGAADTVTNAAPFAGTTGATGSAETRPVNAALNWYVKY